jgi:hypothetical protein
MGVEKIQVRLRLWIIITIIWALAVVIVNLGWVAPKHYSVIGAPFLEEMVKGYTAFMIAAFIYYSPKKNRMSLRNSAVLWGFLIGFFFGFVEINQYNTIQLYLIPLKLVQHPVWTIAVSVAFCSFLLTGKKLLPLVVYLMTVGAHASWNFNANYTSELAIVVSVVLTVLAILIAFWNFPKQSGAHYNARKNSGQIPEYGKWLEKNKIFLNFNPQSENDKN